MNVEKHSMIRDWTEFFKAVGVVIVAIGGIAAVVLPFLCGRRWVRNGGHMNVNIRLGKKFVRRVKIMIFLYIFCVFDLVLWLL